VVPASSSSRAWTGSARNPRSTRRGPCRRAWCTSDGWDRRAPATRCRTGRPGGGRRCDCSPRWGSGVGRGGDLGQLQTRERVLVHGDPPTEPARSGSDRCPAARRRVRGRRCRSPFRPARRTIAAAARIAPLTSRWSSCRGPPSWCVPRANGMARHRRRPLRTSRVRASAERRNRQSDRSARLSRMGMSADTEPSSAGVG
jgi:hypothetical protein